MKRIIAFSLVLEVLVILATSGLNAKDKTKKPAIISNSKINYSTAYSFFTNSKYEEAYTEFNKILEDKTESIINDYVMYYAARSAIELSRYDEARALFSSIQKTYPTSILVPYSYQYDALAMFYKDNYPTNFFYGKTQNWIKEFVGIKAMRKAHSESNTNTSVFISKYLTEELKNYEAAYYLHNNFSNFITNYGNDFLYKIAEILYNGGSYTISKGYFNFVASNTKYKEGAIYYTARVNQMTGKRDIANEQFSNYLASTNFKKYRKDAIYYASENYNSLKNYTEADKLSLTFMKEYPKDNYAPRLYRRLVVNEIRRDNTAQAKIYLTNTLAKFPNNSFTEISLKNYLRKMFLNKNETETYYSINELKKRYPQNRNDFALSWEMWTHNNFNNTNKRNDTIMTTLLTSKNPHYIKESLVFATKEMLTNVSLSNTYYYEEAKKYYEKTNFNKALENLNKIQFIDSIITGKDTAFLKEVRTIFKTIIMNQKFVKDFYAGKTEEELFDELSIQTRKMSDKAIALYYYGDLDNAYNELNEITKKTQMTYPLFYFASKIFVESKNTLRFMQISYKIGSYFGFDYINNVDIMPDEIRRYVYPRYFDEYVVPEAKHYNIEPSYVYAIMREESLFDIKAKSFADAYGLMQLIVPTANMENALARYRFKPLNLNDPKQNIYLGVSHLSRLFKMDGGKVSNYMLVAARYNAGPGSGKRWAETYGTNNMHYTARLVDFEETEYYIERIMKSYDFYKRFYN